MLHLPLHPPVPEAPEPLPEGFQDVPVDLGPTGGVPLRGPRVVLVGTLPHPEEAQDLTQRVPEVPPQPLA